MGQNYLTTKILGIFNSRDFYYYACTGCQKKVDYSSNGFTCYKCNVTKVTISCKYKLMFTIFHKSESIAVTAFNKLLEKYFGCKACDLLKLLDHLNKFDEGSGRLNNILESVISKVFIGQLFIFQLGSVVTSDPETSTHRKSTTIKSMHPAMNDKPFGTVLYSILFDIQCIQKPPPICNYLTNIKSEAKSLKCRVSEIHTKLLQKYFGNKEVQEEKMSDTNISENDKNNESIGINTFMNSTFVRDFFEASFSFVYQEDDNDPCKDACKHKMPESTNSDPNDIFLTQQNKTPQKLDGANGNISLHLLNTPKLQIMPFKSNLSMNDASHEDSLGESFCNSIGRWSNKFGRDNNSYLTSTPSCAQPQIEKRRISEIYQLPSISFSDKTLMSCHDKDKSVTSVFATKDLSAIHDASESMDLFDATLLT